MKVLNKDELDRYTQKPHPARDVIVELSGNCKWSPIKKQTLEFPFNKSAFTPDYS